MSSSKPVVSSFVPTTPLYDQNTGSISRGWLKWFQNMQDAVNAALSQGGGVQPGSLPTPTSSTLGGVLAGGPVANQWATEIDTDGALHFSQPSVASIAGAAPLASPALTGVPTTPTALPLVNDSQIASTAYSDAAVGVEKSRALTAEGLLAPRASPAFTGTVTQPDPSVLTAATTASAASAGGATALPATPAGYLQCNINGTDVKVPYYAL